MSYRHLDMHEREQISRGLAQGLSLREIGRRTGRSASTILREFERNSSSQLAARPDAVNER